MLLVCLGLNAQINPKHMYLSAKQDTTDMVIINSMGIVEPTVVVFPSSFDSLNFVGLGNGQWEFHFLPSSSYTGDAHITIQYYQATNIPGIFLPNYTNLHYRVKESKVEANTDYALVNAAGSVEIDVLSNDSTTDGSLQLERIAYVLGGTATVSNNRIAFESDGSSNSGYIRYFTKDDKGTVESSDLYLAIEDESLIESRSLSTDNLSTLELHLNAGSFSPSQAPSNGILSQSGHVWTYDPNPSFIGTENITFTSPSGGVIDYTITVVNKNDDNSFVQDDQYFVVTDGFLSFNVFDNDYLDDFDIIDYSSDLNYLGDGEFEYTPASGFKGDKVFYYKIYAGFQFHTGNIYVHVDDFAPSTEYSYDFELINNHDLVINHEAPVSDYYFQLTQAPANGTVTILDPNGSESLECDIIQGEHSIIYSPDTDYSGLDMFTIEFCTLTGYCDELDIEVNVLSSNYSDCLCLNDCVYKGDNNNDGAVNLRDALGLAVNIGEAGFERTNDFDLIWTGQESTNWGYSQRNQLVDLKAADADGNGFIDYDDFLEFETYYGQVHNFVPNDVGNLSNTPISFIPQSTDLDSGDLLVIDIYAGNTSNAVLDMLGLSFSFNIDPEVMDSSSVSFELAESNFLEGNGPLYEFVTVPSDGKVDIAVSKLNKLAASGFGLIGTLSFIVEDEIDGLKDILQLGYRSVPFNVNEIVSVDAFGILSRHPNFESEVNVAVQYPDFTQEQLTSDISVYPNPFVNILSIESQNTRIQRLELYDNIGRLIVSRYASGKYESLDLSSIQSGTYLIRITTNKGVITRKVIRLAQ